MEGDKRGMTSGREGDRRRERGGGGGLAGSIGGIMGKKCGCHAEARAAVVKTEGKKKDGGVAMIDALLSFLAP